MNRWFAAALVSWLGVSIATSARAVAEARAPLHVFQHENVLGTSLDLKLAATTAAAAKAGEAAALQEIDRLARILSTYDSSSEASQWIRSAQKPVPVSPELFGVLSLFDGWRARTDGALDPAAGLVCGLWKSAAATQQLPTEAALAEAVAAVHQPHWKLDPGAQTAVHLSSVPLALNSFVKSFIIGRAADAARASAGADAVVLNIGGDLVVRGNLDEPVLIADPRDDAENAEPVARLRVRDSAVATSGHYRRGVEIGGRWYSHIVDPRTGHPTGTVLSATVVAPQATDAGALATSLCVLNPDESLRLVAGIPGAECLLLMADGRRVVSPGWNRFETAGIQVASAAGSPVLVAAASAPTAAVTSSPALTGWDPALELVVTFEIARIADQRSPRPFVAVWIEDKDKYPIRTLALWYRGDRWLPDMRSWYRDEQLRMLTEGRDLMASVSSATRSPGRYTLKWDGKDNAGKPVKPGRYTVLIEAAREHGTYQLMRQDVDFSGGPSRYELKGNVEIAAATLDYRRKTDGR